MSIMNHPDSETFVNITAAAMANALLLGMDIDEHAHVVTGEAVEDIIETVKMMIEFQSPADFLNHTDEVNGNFEATLWHIRGRINPEVVSALEARLTAATDE